MIGPVPLERRKAGVGSAVILALSVIASFVSVLIYALGLPVFPVPSIVILFITAVFLVALASWLARIIWKDGTRWPAILLLFWTLTKQILPDLLYPNALPRFLYTVAMVAALMVIVRSRTARDTTLANVR